VEAHGPSTRPPLDVHLCTPADHAEQARLFNACFKKTLDEAALVWRYDTNPHGASVSFLARPEDGEGISGYACSPRLVVPWGDDAAQAPVGETGDVMTHPDFRKLGIFSSLDRACMQETARLGWPCVFGLPNRRSAHIFPKLGWEIVGSVRPFTFVLKSDGEARRERQVDGRLRALMTPLGHMKGKRARARLRERSRPLVARPLERFPAEVEALSRAVEPRFSLMVRRDAAYLNWRFMDNPSGLHRAFGLFDPAGSLVGYVVIQVPRPGSSLGYLVDLLAPEEAAVAGCMEAGLAALDECGASVARATALDGSWWRKTLEASGFLAPRPENQLTLILYTNDPEHPVARAARDVASWYLTDGDRDDETMG